MSYATTLSALNMGNIRNKLAAFPVKDKQWNSGLSGRSSLIQTLQSAWFDSIL